MLNTIPGKIVKLLTFHLYLPAKIVVSCHVCFYSHVYLIFLVLQVEQFVAEKILIFSLKLEKWLNLYKIFPSINHINHKAPKTFC